MKLYADDPDAHRVYPITDRVAQDISFTPVVGVDGLDVELTAEWLGDPSPTRDLKVSLAGLPANMMLFLRLLIEGDNDIELGYVVLEAKSSSEVAGFVSASAYAQEAKKFRDEAAEITGLPTEAAAQAFNIENDSAVKGALTATIGAAVLPAVAAALATDDAPAQAAAAAVGTALAAGGFVGSAITGFEQWQPDTDYAPDSIVSHAGSRWVARNTGTFNRSRTNRILNPRFASNRAGWSAGSGVTAVVEGASVRLTLGSPVAIGNALFLLSADIPAVEGEVWSAGVEVIVPAQAVASVTVRAAVSFYPTTPTSFAGAPVTVAPGASGRAVSESRTCPAGKTGVRVVVQAGAALPAGTVITLSAPVLERAATAGAYFDGSFIDTDTIDYGWTGAADASASTENATLPNAITDTPTFASGQWRLLATTPTPTRMSPAAAADLGAPANVVRYPAHINLARTRMFSYQSASLAITYDDAETWTVIRTFTNPVRSLRVLDNDEVIVSTRSTDNQQPHELWLSSGMAADPATASWTKVMDGLTAGNGPTNGWSWSTHGPIVLCADYGTKAGANNARHAYLSTDHGRTWKVIYDLGTTVGNHLHGVCYDPYWDRIWLSYGDDTNGILYSDDLGTTWEAADLGTTPGAPYQAVGIVALPHCVLFGSDGTPNGIWRISRTQGKRSGTYQIEEALTFNSATTITHLCHYIYRATRPGDDAPTIFAFGPEVATGKSVVVITRDGYDFHTVWTDSVDTPAGRGVQVAIGPTVRGNLILNANDARYGTGMTRWRGRFPAAY